METIKSRREFERVFMEGRRGRHRLARVTVMRAQDDQPKIAFVAPRRLGNAVYRNRCKRVLREAARLCDAPFPDCKVILFATPATHDSTPAEVAAVLPRLVERTAYHGS